MTDFFTVHLHKCHPSTKRLTLIMFTRIFLSFYAIPYACFILLTALNICKQLSNNYKTATMPWNHL